MNKVFFFLAFLLLALSACDHAPEGDTTEMAMASASPADALITLSGEQRALAEIEDGYPTMSLMSSEILCTGTVEAPPYSQASIYAPVAGFVQHLPHHLPGDFVRQGTELIRLTHPDFARRQRELLESNSRLRFLELDLQRKQELAEGDATSQRSLQQAEADFNLEKARFDGIRAELKMMGFAVDNIIASGEIQSSLAIYAPVSGYLTHVSVNQGMLVSPTDELMMLIDNGHLHLELDVFAKDLPKVAEAQAITCWLPGTDATFPAAVHQIGRVIDPETRTARIHGHFASEPVPLTAGTYMQARIETAPDSVLTVPYTAIAREGEQAFIFVKEGEGYRRQPVQLGREKGDLIELIDYQERHPIAVNGAYYLNGSMGEE